MREVVVMVDPKEEPKSKTESPQELTEDEADKVAGGVGGLQTGLDPSKTKPSRAYTLEAPSPLHPDVALTAGGRIV
jgi:hypothetical protein